MTRAERERVKAQKLASFFRHVERTYGITETMYRALYAAQGGRCYICRVADGSARMLAVDHDHGCRAGHDPENGCPRCVRGLLCSGSRSASTCNRLIGMYRREALIRAVEYTTPGAAPAQAILGALEHAQGSVNPTAAAIQAIFPELDLRQAQAIMKVATT